MPMVQSALKARFGRKLRLTDFDLTVAKGAAIYANNYGHADVEPDSPDLVGTITPADVAVWLESGIVGGAAWAAVQSTISTIRGRIRRQRDEKFGVTTRDQAIALSRRAVQYKFLLSPQSLKAVSEVAHPDGSWTIFEDGESRYEVEVPKYRKREASLRVARSNL
jgi:hypothetical protein